MNAPIARSRPRVPLASRVTEVGDPAAMQRLAEAHRRLAEVTRIIERSRGRREALERRLEELTQDVGRAKGRLLKKPEVDAFLEELQADLHRKAVGSYERMLTAICQDVIGGDIRIGLNLSTDRGLPALDIYVDKDGNREDIIEGVGGSVTNVVSLGLRMITTVRSGGRRFLALDEPDCWVKPSNVKSFYNVIHGVGQKMNMQSLIVSHHAIDLMPEGIAVARLYRDANGMMTCENDPRAGTWDPEMPGIRRIRLVNMMSHEDTQIRLAPGATAIIGENNIGKSVVARALKAMCYGEISDTDLRHDQKQVRIEVEIENNRVLVLTRQPKRTPVNEWTLETPEGEILTNEHGEPYQGSASRGSVPDWVSKISGIERFEDLQHQLSHQKLPVFLLNEVPSKRASVLSIGRESGYVQRMLVRHRETARADSALVKSGEIEVASINQDLAQLEAYEKLADSLSALERDLQLIESGAERTRHVMGLLAEAEDNAQRLAVARPRLELLRKLDKEPPTIWAGTEKLKDCDRVLRELTSTRAGLLRMRPQLDLLKANRVDEPKLNAGTEALAAIHRVGRELADVQKRLAASRGQLKALAQLPAQPVLGDQAGVTRLLADLEQVEGRLGAARDQRAAAAKEREKVEADLAKAVDEVGGVCPLCASHIDHKHMIA